MTAPEVDAVLKCGREEPCWSNSAALPRPSQHTSNNATPLCQWIGPVNSYEHWRQAVLPGAVRLDINEITATQVVDQILHHWTDSQVLTLRRPRAAGRPAEYAERNASPW